MQPSSGLNSLLLVLVLMHAIMTMHGCARYQSFGQIVPESLLTGRSFTDFASFQYFFLSC